MILSHRPSKVLTNGATGDVGSAGLRPAARPHEREVGYSYRGRMRLLPVGPPGDGSLPVARNMDRARDGTAVAKKPDIGKKKRTAQFIGCDAAAVSIISHSVRRSGCTRRRSSGLRHRRANPDTGKSVHVTSESTLTFRLEEPFGLPVEFNQMTR